jgi:pantothenate kinase type III
MAGFDLDSEIKRLLEINKERNELYSEAKGIVDALRGITTSSSASPSEKQRVRNAVKPYTRQKPKKPGKKLVKKTP